MFDGDNLSTVFVFNIVAGCKQIANPHTESLILYQTINKLSHHRALINWILIVRFCYTLVAWFLFENQATRCASDRCFEICVSLTRLVVSSDRSQLCFFEIRAELSVSWWNYRENGERRGGRGGAWGDSEFLVTVLCPGRAAAVRWAPPSYSPPLFQLLCARVTVLGGSFCFLPGEIAGGGRGQELAALWIWCSCSRGSGFSFPGVLQQIVRCFEVCSSAAMIFWFMRRGRTPFPPSRGAFVLCSGISRGVGGHVLRGIVCVWCRAGRCTTVMMICFLGIQLDDVW